MGFELVYLKKLKYQTSWGQQQCGSVSSTDMLNSHRHAEVKTSTGSRRQQYRVDSCALL